MTRGKTVSLLAAVAVSGGVAFAAFAQAQRANESSRVISGGDIGFRVERLEGDRAVGTLVVRIDGKWVEALGAPKAMAVR